MTWRTFRRPAGLLACVASATVVAALGVASPAAAAPAAGYANKKCAAFDTGCALWNVSKSGDRYTKIDGYVVDHAADAHCIQAIITWYHDENGQSRVVDVDRSGRACPKGDTDHFTKKPGDGALAYANRYLVEVIQV